jgi:hypothetical protein
MRDNELMRNDFVMFFDRHKIGHKAKVDQVLRYSCLLMYNATPEHTSYEDEIIVNYEDIHPIELTKNVIEKFGFVSVDGRIFSFDTGDGASISFISVDDGAWVSGRIKIKYLHELQQVMRMLGIQTEILENIWEK